MRWESLFSDLDAQAATLERAERAAEADELARAEFAALTLTDRLRGALGERLRVQAAGGCTLHGRLLGCGRGWLLLEEDLRREALVCTTAVLAVAGLGRHAVTATVAGPVEARFGLRPALRAIARDRSAVRLLLVDGSSLAGRLGRVGADFVELSDGRHARWSVPYPALAAVRRDGADGVSPPSR
jgi:hypothetical protein